MARPERLLDPAGGPVTEFASALRKLREDAGTPKYLQMARRTGRSRTALAEAAGGDHLPTWDTVEAFVRACDGDVLAWRSRWEQVKSQQETVRGGAQQPTSPHLHGTANSSADDAATTSEGTDEARPHRLDTGRPPAVPAESPVKTPPAGVSAAGYRSWLLHGPQLLRGLLLAATAVAVLAVLALVVLPGRRQGAVTAAATEASTGPVVVTVQNKVAISASTLIEDRTPVYLSSRPVARCGQRHCIVAGTNTMWSGTLLPAICVVHGEVLTNADLSSPGIKSNPGAVTSDLWYKVVLPGDVTGYVPEAYLTPSSRGGRGLPNC